MSAIGCFTILGSVTGVVVDAASSEPPESLDEVEPGSDIEVRLRDGHVLFGEYQGYSVRRGLLFVLPDDPEVGGEDDDLGGPPSSDQKRPGGLDPLVGFDYGTISIPTQDIEAVQVVRIDPIGTGALIGATVDLAIVTVTTVVLASGPFYGH